MNDIKLFARDHNNVFQNYSIVLLDDQKPVIDCYDSILPVMVPATSTRPEKGMVFMQWLMTNDDVADRLTFGSQIMKMNHYTFSDDCIIIPEKYNTIYAFCHLIANFYKMVESQHGHYDYLFDSFQKTHLTQGQREKLLNDRIIDWIKDSNTLSSFDSL